MADALNIERFGELLEYLRENGHIAADETPRFTRLAGGVSNRTVRVDCPHGRSFVLKQALPKLRVETEWFSDPRRIEQEARGLVWLEGVVPPGTIAPMRFQDPAQYLLAMEAVPEPHENWKTALLAGRIERRWIEQFGIVLATIHRRSREEPGEPRARFGDRRFFESLRLEPYYRYTISRQPAAGKCLRELIEETMATRLAIVHGDYSPKNVLVTTDRFVLLDHEVIHFGDPAFDIGFSLAHLLSKAHHVRERREAFLAAAECYWQTYQRVAGELPRIGRFEARAARHAAACLLARVEGRSPLEYLTSDERDRQRRIVLALIEKLPERVEELVRAFGEKLARFP